jgi:hypothetical protein
VTDTAVLDQLPEVQELDLYHVADTIDAAQHESMLAAGCRAHVRAATFARLTEQRDRLRTMIEGDSSPHAFGDRSGRLRWSRQSRGPTRTRSGYGSSLHADRVGPPLPVSTQDRDNLWLFAEHFALLYERSVFMERLEPQRSQLHDLERVDRRRDADQAWHGQIPRKAHPPQA